MKPLLFLSLALLLSTCVAVSAQQTSASINLVGDGGFEEKVSTTQPAGWEPLTIGAASQFSLDDHAKHSGAFSARIVAPEMARSYWRSAPIAVAPGEKVSASASVKVKDAPADHGTVIVIAEFSDAKGLNVEVAKFATADVKNLDWQQVRGIVTVPANKSNLRLRIGFSYSNGTTWWDDVSVTAEKALVARLDLNEPVVSPAMKAIPVSILNRGEARDRATVRVTMGDASNAADVQLTGEPVQRVDVPLKIDGRGKRTIELSMTRGGDEVVFSQKREVTIPPPIVLRPVSPTHWVTEDAPPRIEGELDVAMSDDKLGSHAFIRVLDASGAERAKLDIAQPHDGAEPFVVPMTPPSPVGNYKIVATLGEARAEQPWHVIHRADAETTINADGFLVHHGQPIFPLGVFNGGARMKECGEAGFTVAHAYNAANVEYGERPNDQLAKDFLDNAERNGMSVCFLIPRGQVFHGDWEGFRRRVRLLRNHPALLCWDEEEGIARGDMPPGSLAKLRQIIREEDPNHPLMVGDSRDVISRMGDRSNFFPADEMDLGMWWWYPLPLKVGPTSANALEGEEALAEPELAPPTFLVKRNIDKPIWVGVQSYKKSPTSRYPTPTEYRAQAYIAVIHGAKGLMWYGGSVTGGIYLAPAEGHWDELKRLAGELNQMSPVFMAAEDGPPVHVLPESARISVSVRRPPDRLVMLAANRATTAADVTLSSASIVAGDAKVLYEDRSLRTRDGEMADHFEPLAVHAYELPRR
jgi:hypothetical protein